MSEQGSNDTAQLHAAHSHNAACIDLAVVTFTSFSSTRETIISDRRTSLTDWCWRTSRHSLAVVYAQPGTLYITGQETPRITA